MKPERREFIRHRVPPGLMYVFAHNSVTPWEIENIGKGGLAFQYTPFPGEEIEMEAIEIVWSSGDQKRLSGIPCKTAYDINIIPAGQTYSGKNKRLRGLQFVKLTKEQRVYLELLLRSSDMVAV